MSYQTDQDFIYTKWINYLIIWLCPIMRWVDSPKNDIGPQKSKAMLSDSCNACVGQKLETNNLHARVNRYKKRF